MEKAAAEWDKEETGAKHGPRRGGAAANQLDPKVQRRLGVGKRLLCIVLVDILFRLL